MAGNFIGSNGCEAPPGATINVGRAKAVHSPHLPIVSGIWAKPAQVNAGVGSGTRPGCAVAVVGTVAVFIERCTRARPPDKRRADRYPVANWLNGLSEDTRRIAVVKDQKAVEAPSA